MSKSNEEKETVSDVVILPIPGATTTSNGEMFDFTQLKLIEDPNSPLNSESLPQTLEDCVGYLEELPLKQPNVDQKKPRTVVDMINILTNPNAVEAFEAAQKEESTGNTESSVHSVYDYHNSAVMEEQLYQLKDRTLHKSNCFIGKVVPPGSIALYNQDQVTFAAGEGRWLLLPPFFGYWVWGSGCINLNQDVIKPQGTQVLIIRILSGEVGLVMEQGNARLLDVGTHVYNSGTVVLRSKLKYAESSFFCHGPYNYVRVSRGKYAKVWAEVESSTDGMQSLVPRLLKEGEHYIKSNLFKFDGFVDASDEYIHHGSVHIISVPKGNVAKVFHNNKPRLLGEGTHIVESVLFEFMGMENITTSASVTHGTITIVRVTRGEVALVWNKNEPLFFDQPGLYEFNSEDFRLVEFKRADEKQIELGAKKIIQVYTGEVGITYEQGKLKILNSGRHIIDSSTHIFQRFLSTKQKSIRLVTLDAGQRTSRSQKSLKGKKEDVLHTLVNCGDSDLTICETKDLVKVGVRADVFYSISDPQKCIENIDTEELEDLVRETAVATLTNIIRSTALNQIAQSHHVSAFSQDGTDGCIGFIDDKNNGNAPSSGGFATPSAPMFFDRAHDEFMNKLHDDFMHRYGVDIANIRMESFKIMDTELSNQISRQAITTAKVENELANLEGQSQILTQKEQTASEVKNINAKAEALALKTKIDAENQRKIEVAQAEAEALKIAVKAKAEAEYDAVLMKARAEAEAAKAEAEALKIATKARAEAESEAVLMKAKADAEAISLKAAAESERAGVLSQTKLGQQECLLGLYSEMVKGSNQGVEKVVYLDPSVNRDSPFALGSLNNLNRDLHALSRIGIATGDSGEQKGLIEDEEKKGDF